jgi:hypothetical protein
MSPRQVSRNPPLALKDGFSRYIRRAGRAPVRERKVDLPKEGSVKPRAQAGKIAHVKRNDGRVSSWIEKREM